MDFSLQLMVYPSGYPAVPAATSGLYSRGEVVGVLLPSEVGSPNPNGRLCFVHITGSPIAFPRLKLALLENWADGETVNGRGVWIADVAGFFAAYPAKYTELRDTKETTMPWVDAEIYLLNKRTGGTLKTELAAGNY